MRITSTVTVAAPRTAVFAAFADIENAPARMSGIESVDFVSDVRTGLGTRGRETRRMYGRAATEEMEITAFDAPSGYTVEAAADLWQTVLGLDT
ncbi:SRPBCC family protein, partial [Tsukamurella tyrosinosolvens]|uniref:SRPBCC family protein n=1 Tax=Tsukamurella tyrosinosolvens TaxID=57704 RepID=UPI0024816CD5